jgi:hypothetical protein
MGLRVTHNKKFRKDSIVITYCQQIEVQKYQKCASLKDRV